MLLAWSLLVSLALARALAEDGVKIKEFAVPTSVKAGENVELQCQVSLLKPPDAVDFAVKWYLNTRDRPPLLLYQRINEDQRSTLHKILWKGNDSIELVNMQPNHTGVYECAASNYNVDRRVQALVVYTPGTGPNLTITEVEGDTGDKSVQLACTADGVAPEPELAIFIGQEQISNGTLVQYSKDTGSWSAAAQAAVRALHHASEVSCELFFTDADISHAQYVDKILYSNSDGGEPSTTEAAEPAKAIATEQQNGNGVGGLLCSWLVVFVSCSLLLQGRRV